jgi:uncharacterized damage-inducible protein DinB
MKTQTLNDLQKASADLQNLISAFKPEHFNRVPFEGSWTAGQVAEHILKSYNGILEVISDQAGPTERKPDEKIEAIKDLFLNFDTKMSSPDFVLPSAPPHNQQTLLQESKDLLDKMTTTITSQDLSATYNAFELPGFGKFTRLEWVYFLVYHLQRHNHQLNKIYQKIQGYITY